MSDEHFSLEQLERGFARTRLNPPLLDRQLLERPQLLHRLGEAVLAHQLTLISAPAGSGKTTLAAALKNVLAVPIAWLTLDREDNDPVAFLTLAVLALRQKYHDLGTT